ncbi:MAG: hypothetical protein WAV09_03450 [Minisyncoccia bacterium]
MTKHLKVPRARTSAFVRGTGRVQVVLYFSDEQVGILSDAVQSTEQVYVDDALMVLLMALTSMPLSEMLAHRQSHLNLLGEYASIVDRIFSQKRREAELAASQEITKHLMERGITE